MVATPQDLFPSSSSLSCWSTLAMDPYLTPVNLKPDAKAQPYDKVTIVIFTTNAHTRAALPLDIIRIRTPANALANNNVRELPNDSKLDWHRTSNQLERQSLEAILFTKS
ncbi:hypothetical protein HAX54_002577, partial [Datura stramonium]|nr:hypothetical protein [Datura stramonium]